MTWEAPHADPVAPPEPESVPRAPEPENVLRAPAPVAELPVPPYGLAVISLPLGARGPRPVVVAGPRAP